MKERVRPDGPHVIQPSATTTRRRCGPARVQALSDGNSRADLKQRSGCGTLIQWAATVNEPRSPQKRSKSLVEESQGEGRGGDCLETRGQTRGQTRGPTLWRILWRNFSRSPLAPTELCDSFDSAGLNMPMNRSSVLVAATGAARQPPEGKP